MQISTTARHCELDPEDRLFARQRLEKFERFARDIREAHLIITSEGGHRHSAEITIKLKRHEMVSREESTAPRAAIDLAAERLETQLRRLKEKRISRKRNPRSNGAVAPAREPDDAAEPGDSGIGED
jgi:ribosomal subunit interface protein